MRTRAERLGVLLGAAVVVLALLVLRNEDASPPAPDALLVPAAERTSAEVQAGAEAAPSERQPIAPEPAGGGTPERAPEPASQRAPERRGPEGGE